MNRRTDFRFAQEVPEAALKVSASSGSNLITSGADMPETSIKF